MLAGKGRGGGGVFAPLPSVPTSEIYLDRAHAVPHVHLVARAILMVGESESVCLWQREGLYRRAADLRKPVSVHVRNNDHDMYSTFSQVLHDNSPP